MRPMINEGIQTLRQTGTLGVISKKWETKLPNADLELKTILSTEHTAVVFLAFGAALVLAGAIFLTELGLSSIFVRIFKKQRSK